jgi:hypothetical protein
MQTVYIGNTLVNDVMLGSQRMDDVTRNSRITAEYLVVAGGAAGGSGGGNGAGGLLSGSLTLVGGTVYQVYVAPRVGGTSDNVKGNDSYFTGSNAYLYAFGGGYGANPYSVRGSTGGSGGGGANNAGGDYGGKAGIVGQGNSGGDGAADSSRFGGGGGGAGSAGSAGSSTIGGNGGNGKQSAIDGTLQYYAGGGAGCRDISTPQYGSPGLGAPSVGSSARDNSGSGNNPRDSATFAGSGYVVIRYLGNPIATGGTIVKDGDYTVHKFSNTGSATFYLN